MFGSAAWRRHRAAKAKAACERTVRELGDRAAVREAEDLVESAWVRGLDRAERTDPTVRGLLEHERAAFAEAGRRREAEAEQDQQRLADARQELARQPGKPQPGTTQPPSGEDGSVRPQ